MARPTDLTVRVLVRNAWIVAGLLVLGVGVGDLMVGRAKLSQYQDVLVHSPRVTTRDPAVLFPRTNEAEEQQSVALAKLGFYRVLFIAGQILTLGGLVLLAVGFVRLVAWGPPPAGSPTRSR